MKNFKIIISYDGNNFSGWQTQSNARTVQKHIEDKISTIFKDQDINLIAAGRTDSGVHAFSQVANIKLNTDWDTYNLTNALNAKTDDDVWVNKIEEVPLDFHSRFSAKSRKYKYYLSLDYSPIKRNRIWWIKKHINIDILKKCASEINKTTDFTRFCKANSEVKNKICNIIESKWNIELPKLTYEIRANRFLHHMVRFLVGTMIEVASENISMQVFKTMLEGKVTKTNIVCSPPHGLYLYNIEY